MNNQNTDASEVADSWDTYWHGTGDVGAFTSGGVNHPLILSFWDRLFAHVKQNQNHVRVMDLASGNGAVIERAFSTLDQQQLEMSCLDVSEAAINNIRDRFPQVNGIVSDARKIPLESGGYDIVTSQFGIEYAGADAILEAARMVAENGQLILMLHHQGSSIHQECV